MLAYETTQTRVYLEAEYSLIRLRKQHFRGWLHYGKGLRFPYENHIVM